LERWSFETRWDSFCFLRFPFSAVLGQSLWSFLIVVSAVGSLVSHGVAQFIEPSRFPFSDDIERW
jgi:hypothetical protein